MGRCDRRLGDGFSGLLGGVLNGETRSSEGARSGCGDKDRPSWKERAAGFAGILGFSTRFAGGGNDALFDFRSDCASFAGGTAPGDRCPIFRSVGTDEAKVGVTGRV